MTENERNLAEKNIEEQLSFRLSRDSKRQFRAKLMNQGLDVTNVLRKFVEETIAGSSDPACRICSDDPEAVKALRKLLRKRSFTPAEIIFLGLVDVFFGLPPVKRG